MCLVVNRNLCSLSAFDEEGEAMTRQGHFSAAALQKKFREFLPKCSKCIRFLCYY